MTLPPAPERGSIQTSAILLIVLGVLCGGWIPTIFGILAYFVFGIAILGIFGIAASTG